MCIFGGKPPAPPPIVEPPAPPPPPEPTPEAPVIDEGGKRSTSNGRDAQRKGISALRISLNVPQLGGQGVNVPS